MLVQFFATVSGASSLMGLGDGTQSATQATSISHTYPTTNLNYVIKLSLINTCGDTLDIVHTLNEVGMSEFYTEIVNLFPNPVSGEFLNLEFMSPLTGEYIIYDNSGKLLDSKKFELKSNLEISTSKLPTGYYRLNIISYAHSAVLPFVKID